MDALRGEGESRLLSSVIVVGSANVDLGLQVDHLPRPGETSLTRNRTIRVGGKGVNQAVSAAKLGARTSFVGCVGDDSDGRRVLSELRSAGVDTTSLEILNGVETGLAVVMVAEGGENTILVVPGANGLVPEERVSRVIEKEARPGSVVVVQGEIPGAAIEAAVRAGNASGCFVVLNLAPVVPIAREVLRLVDVLIVNEVEAASLLGRSSVGPSHVRHAAAELSEWVAHGVVITLGEAGAYWQERSGTGGNTAAWQVEVVETTGAGDAFVGACAASASRGSGIQKAAEYGALAGTYAVQGMGAQSSYPSVDQLNTFAQQLRLASAC